MAGEVNRVGGFIRVSSNGNNYEAVGAFEFTMGFLKKTGMVNATEVAGYKTEQTIPTISGMARNTRSLDIDALLNTDDATVVLELATGKQVMIEHAWYSGDGKGNTDEGTFPLEFQGKTHTYI